MSLDFSSCTPDAAPLVAASQVERCRPGEAGPDLLAQWVESRDERFLALLMAAHRPMVAAVCRRILGHRFDADEVADEVFADFAQEAASIRGQPGAWLRRVATHRAWRRNHRCTTTQAALRGDDEAVQETRDVIEGDEERSRRCTCMATALGSLSETERQVVVEHFYRYRSPAEIAGAAGISARAVRKRLSAALDRLSRQEILRSLYAEMC